MSDSTPPFDIGIIGAGQLARMMLQAAIPLGLRVQVLATAPDESAALVSSAVALGRPEDRDALTAVARTSAAVTLDHELVDTALIASLEAEGAVFRPASSVAALAQDKRHQREGFANLGLPVPPYLPAASLDDLLAFGREHGWPLVAKSRRGGYDGRGVWVLGDEVAATDLWNQTHDAGVELLIEDWVPIEMELAAMVARAPGGEVAAYPLVQTVQVDGICHEVLAPAAVPTSIAREAEQIARTIAEAYDITGILAVELFYAGGRLLINEIATRPHNSGHYSIEGCLTSQFENHLRAVAGLPLGDTTLVAPAAVMVNVIGGLHTGDLRARLRDALTVPGVHIHLYGKGARPGRKLGHVTAIGPDRHDARARALRAAALLRGPDTAG